MKIAVLLGDGMAGEPLEELGGRTTLQAAHTPEMDRLATLGTLGLACTVPEGYPAGSDVANLSAFGYDPAECYTGRAPLEAVAMGVELGEGDVAYRMNLVSFVASSSNVFMHDFTGDHVTNGEAREIIATLVEELSEPGFEFHPGISYRNLFVWRKGELNAKCTPPHDITGQPIHSHLPQGPGASTLLNLMTGSQILLKNHPVNLRRRDEGRFTVDSIWLWGQGLRPKMASYAEKFGLTGQVVCAVDLVRGIGRAAGLECPLVPGATGYLDTDYDAKASAAIAALKMDDFVFVHVEAPDEAGHAGLMDEKIKAIERFDHQVVGPVSRALEASGEPYKLLVLPDHPTPIRIRTHSRDPVPFVMVESGAAKGTQPRAYSEEAARATGVYVPHGHELMAHMAGRVRLW